MLSFKSLIEKGYLKQAETTLNSVNPELPGYEFNLALLKMLKGQSLEAYEILKRNYSTSKNM